MITTRMGGGNSANNDAERPSRHSHGGPAETAETVLILLLILLLILFIILIVILILLSSRLLTLAVRLREARASGNEPSGS